MDALTTVESLEAVVGTRPQMVLMKTIDALDDGSHTVVAHAPIAWFGFRDTDGTPHTTLVGGSPGFARVESPTRMSFDIPADRPTPAAGGGVSLILLLPGVGETLRITGSVASRTDTNVVIDLAEAFVHCAKCILRSRLWERVPDDSATPTDARAHRNTELSGPLADLAVAEFLVASPFVAVSSWDGNGAGDTSPKGDRAGFVRVLDGQTIAIPDRKGNRRTDTFHNLLTCDQVSLAAIVPGSDEILHMTGTAHVSADTALLSTMAVAEGERTPKAALIVRVERAEIMKNEALRLSNIWDPSSHVDISTVPDLMQLAAHHLAVNRTVGAKASMTRALSRGLAKAPKKLMRKGFDAGYRKELKDEGF